MATRLARFATSLLVVAALTSSACVTTTKIISEPTGADVLDQGKKKIGVTPYNYETKMWIWEEARLNLKKEGFKSKEVILKRSEPDVLPIVGAACLSATGFVSVIGFACGVPVFLAAGMKLPAETKVKLDAGGEAPPAADAAAVKTVPVAMNY